MSDAEFFELRDSLRQLRDSLPALWEETFGPSDDPRACPWYDKLLHNVLPALDFDLPVLLVAVCGGGSTGKSTLFNALAGRQLSQVGFTAGLTARVLLAGHPSVLSGEQAAQALLYRLGEAPTPWRSAEDTIQAGPPLYATTEALSPSTLLIDTPDFDTGIGGQLINRSRAEPILRTAEVFIYLFSNTVYNNLSNTEFIAQTVGGIGGRPVVLVYRISRAASDEEVLSHCRVVAQRLYGGPPQRDGFPQEVLGVYRVHESDAVAEGRSLPRPIPVGQASAGRELADLLAGLDVARLKRHAFAADLRDIHRAAAADMGEIELQVHGAAHYGLAVREAMAEESLDALRSFPANEAIALATRIFLDSSPNYVRWLRSTGRVVGLPFKILRQAIGGLSHLLGDGRPAEIAAEPEETLSHDLLLSANALRNRLLDDALILRVSKDHPLVEASRAARMVTDTIIEPLGAGLFNLHVPAPSIVREHEEAMLAQDWAQTTEVLRRAAKQLLGMPTDIEDELASLIRQFRAEMGWTQRLRESFFASLAALPPLLGVTYTLLTADPVSGGGIWIQLQSLFGINDLWALVSIPAAAGLSERDRQQLETMIRPVFGFWFERRLKGLVDLYARTICAPVLGILEGIPAPEDARFDRVHRALANISEAT